MVYDPHEIKQIMLATPKTAEEAYKSILPVITDARRLIVTAPLDDADKAQLSKMVLGFFAGTAGSVCKKADPCLKSKNIKNVIDKIFRDIVNAMPSSH